MTARISSRQVAGELPKNLPWDEFQQAIVESASQIRLLTLPQDKGEAARYERGHAFGELAEMRWTLRANGRYHVVYISDRGGCLPDFTDEADLKAGDDGQIILWGERDAETYEFFDGRIPEPLPYPDRVPGKRLAVRVRHYSLTEGKPERTVFLFRCVTIAVAEGGV